MATVRLTVGSVLDTVTTAANTVNSTLNAVSSGVGMLNSYVEKAAAEQVLRHKADTETFIDRLIEEKAQEQAITNLNIESFCARSEGHAKHYEKSYNRYDAILRPKKDNIHQFGVAAE